MTPLHVVVNSGRNPEDVLKCVKLLLAKGADPNLRDASGKTAIDRARESGQKEILKLINKEKP